LQPSPCRRQAQIASTRRGRRLAVLLMVPVLVLGLAAASPSPAFAKSSAGKKAKPKLPRGAIKLPSSKIKRVGGTVCGKVNEYNWKPGRVPRAGYFIDEFQIARNAGRAAKILRRKARRSQRLARRTKDPKKKAALLRRAKKLRLGVKAERKKEKLFKSRYGRDSAICNPSIGIPGREPLRLSIAAASGLALRSPSQAPLDSAASGSNLEALIGGQLQEAVVSGTARISRFIIGPGQKTYLVFEFPTYVSDEAPKCVLVEVDKATGIPTCVDSSLNFVNWPENAFGGNPGVQFDAAGAVYYTGFSGTDGVLRRRTPAGIVTDLISGNVQLQNFLVLPDGWVIIAGSTISTGTSWVRAVSPGGSLKSLATAPGGFIGLFSDGNAYLGLESKVQRYDSASNSLESKAWIGEGDAYYEPEAICAGCGSIPWPSAPHFAATSNGDVFSYPGGTLARYYSVPAAMKTEVKTVTTIVAAGSRLILSGLNESGQNVTVAYDPATETDAPLIGPAEETEVYHLSYAPSTNRVLFDGLRFADNRYVIGEVDLSGGQVSISAAGTAKWQEIQAFG
jgi:hypothetical protein